jgi:hypothetical protein
MPWPAQTLAEKERRIYAQPHVPSGDEEQVSLFELNPRKTVPLFGRKDNYDARSALLAA